MIQDPKPAQRRRPRRRRPTDPLRQPLPAFPLPALNYPEELPITARKDEIVAAIREHPVVVITGATGSGKSTQLPKMCLEAGRGVRGRIACTQPRRIAATTVAARVAEELGAAGEALVGYKIRFADHTRPTTRIQFVTDGLLLAETQGDPDLGAYDTIIVDEAHERSLNIDFLLGILKRLVARRADLRVIITSATIDTEKFSRAFGGAPIIEVSGRTYPVETRYRPLDPEAEEAGDVTYVDQAVEAAVELARDRRGGDLLVFMPTERDIVETVEALEKRNLDGCVVLPLFGRLSGGEQGRVFRPAGGRKIVVATNVAETSVTVPGIRTVIDTGLARIASYNPRARTHSLPVCPISRASADQRKGRCGRVGPGVCIRLYAEDDYAARPEFTLPEIQRANLAEVLLRMLALKLGDPSAFPFIDPPHPRAVKDGFATLTELGAIDAGRQLTPAGRLMARLPLDPRVSRMILEADKQHALREVLVIAAGLSVQDPRERPAEQRPQADQAHARFQVLGSDFLSYLKIWDAYHDTLERLRSQGQMRKFCKQHFLSFNRMREWRDVHEQLTAVLKQEKGFTLNQEDADFAAIHRAILAGHLRNIGLKKEKNTYLGAQNKVLTLFPGSGQVGKAGRWIVAGELVETSRLFARTVATIEEAWLEELAGPLCRRSYAEPHWEKNRGQVVATERVTLFGLPIVAGRAIDYGRIDPAAAREIFIRAALVEGELKGEYGFLAHNRALLGELEELESRLRRRGYSPDDETLYAFYDQRLGELCDQRSFARLLRERGSDEFLRLSREDLLAEAPEQDELEPFPETLRVAEVELPLTYRFEPGREDDGVSVAIPAALAPHLRAERFEWLVPGLLEEKVTLLLKGLPKRLRRFLVPVPDTAAQVLAEVEPGEGSLYGQLQAILQRRFRLRVQRDDWSPEALPPHLTMRFCLVGQDGAVLTATRYYAELLAAADPARPMGTGATAGTEATLAAARAQWERENLTDYDVPDVPERISLGRSPAGVEGFAFPALVRDAAGRVSLRLLPTPAESAAATRAGLPALYAARFAGELAVLRKDLAIPRQRWPLFQGLGGQEAVTRALLGCVLAEVFETRDGRLPSRAQFQARVESLKGGGLFRRARQVHDLLLELFTERRQVLELLARYGKAGGAGAGWLLPLQGELERLFPADFLETPTAAQWPHLLRYLKALALRIERAHLAPAKDAERQALLEPHLQRLASARESGPLSVEQAALVEAFGQMVEEYRVSLFAQEVGTAFPVSAKRLEKQWEELQGWLDVRVSRGRR